jgi:hypothetical protein
MSNHTRKLALIKLPLSIEQMQKREKIKNEILTEIFSLFVMTQKIQNY